MTLRDPRLDCIARASCEVAALLVLAIELAEVAIISNKAARTKSKGAGRIPPGISQKS